MHVYQFTGRIHPERANVNLSAQKLGVGIPSLGWKGTVTVFVGASQIFVTFEGEPPVTNIPTLRNSAQNLAQDFANAFCYEFGYAYTAEITGLVSDESEYQVFGVDYGAIAETEQQRALPLDKRLLALVLTSFPLGRAISDLRSAILEPRDTAFHCQRAIESLRHHFTGERREQWERLREALNVTEETLRSIEEAGRAQRHGEVAEMTAADRDTAVLLAWRVIDRFVAYLDNDEKPLAGTEFPAL